MKRSSGSAPTGPTGPRRDVEAYGLRRRGLRFIEDLPTRDEYTVETDAKRGAVIVRRKSDKAIVMVCKGDRCIMKVVV